MRQIFLNDLIFISSLHKVVFLLVKQRSFHHDKRREQKSKTTNGVFDLDRRLSVIPLFAPLSHSV